jgi:L-2,4-diaminobutyric acid acetyltransferase
MSEATNTQAALFRQPAVTDAEAMWRLVRDSGRLDPNSAYCYLLLCRYFADTCLVAEHGGVLRGFVTAFVPPGEAATLFVWQIAVAEEARGQGLGTQLLQRLLELPACRHVTQVEATVSPSNAPSRRLFESFARLQGAVCEQVQGGGFAAALFPDADAAGGGHEAEPQLRILLRR